MEATSAGCRHRCNGCFPKAGTFWIAYAIGLLLPIGLVAEDPDGVFPRDLVPVEELEVLSIYPFTYGVIQEFDHYLLGMSEGNLVLATRSSTAERIKLPLSFDLTAVSPNLLGGANGEVAIQQGRISTFPGSYLDHRLLQEQDWQVSDLGTNAPVTSVQSHGGTCFALSAGQLFSTNNGGQTWGQVTEVEARVEKLMGFAGSVLALSREDSQVGLYRFDTTSGWVRVWEFSFGVTRVGAIFQVMTLNKRLFISVYGWAEFVMTWDAVLSTTDGINWSQHGSNHWIKSSGDSDWNPLDLPDDRRFYLSPAWTPEPVDGGLSAAGGLDSIRRYSGNIWRPHPLSTEGTWVHSDWLGWYKVEDPESGVINHKVLGPSWVKSIGDRKHWMLTEHLGWIYVFQDWSPWVRGLDDEHWYWLDLYDGRVWDDTDGEWFTQ